MFPERSIPGIIFHVFKFPILLFAPFSPFEYIPLNIRYPSVIGGWWAHFNQRRQDIADIKISNWYYINFGVWALLVRGPGYHFIKPISAGQGRNLREFVLTTRDRPTDQKTVKNQLLPIISYPLVEGKCRACTFMSDSMSQFWRFKVHLEK